ncbi:UbiA prenyltransferase family [Melanogaster broomeanus]|nr:UbiA prenyltransferase family [Melanogaster broomeanus]
MTVQYLVPRISDIPYHLYTLFLFTKNDIRTAAIPVTLFAVAAAPLCSPIHVLHSAFWIWLHLLQFNVANQVKAPEEDKVNKPSRPLPAGRITVDNATILRWFLAPLCLGYSALYSTQLVFASLEMQLFTIWYNELDGDKKWMSKNLLTAIMYGCLELGGTLTAGSDSSKLSQTGITAIQLSVAVFATTLHCQDFKDVGGDRLTGRRTFPMMFPIASRISIGLGLPLWSICLCYIWDFDWLCTAMFVAYGCFVGARFMLYRTVEADRRSCKYYSVSAIAPLESAAYAHQ